MLQRECQRQDEEHIWEAVEDGQTDPWPPPPVSKMSLSKTLKLRVNCHSEQPSGSSDSVVSHHCVTVNVTTSALWRQKHSLYRFCFRRLFPGNIWKTSPAQWRISYNFFIREGKVEHSKHSIKIKTTTKKSKSCHDAYTNVCTFIQQVMRTTQYMILLLHPSHWDAS